MATYIKQKPIERSRNCATHAKRDYWPKNNNIK